MFSLIKRGVAALRPEQCSLCPYGDGTHPPAKIRWDILDKDAKSLLSKRRIASGSLLMLPDHAATDPIGGPRDAVLPDLLCSARDSAELPRPALEGPALRSPEPSTPQGAGVQVADPGLVQTTDYLWNSISNCSAPAVAEGWRRTTGGPVLPRAGAQAGPGVWQPPVHGFTPVVLSPIDLEIEVQLRAQPSGYPLQAALPLSKADKLTWSPCGTLPGEWREAVPGPSPEVRKHRPLYAAPSTPVPLPAPLLPAIAAIPRRETEANLTGFGGHASMPASSWIPVSRTDAPRGLTPVIMPRVSNLRQRYRGWQGTARLSDWPARHQGTAEVLASPLWQGVTIAPQVPGGVPALFRPVRVGSGDMADLRRPSDFRRDAVGARTARFGRAAVAVPEILD